MNNAARIADQEDETLVRRMADGEERALSDFYDRHAGTLMGVAMRVLGDATAAEDVVQEVFVQVWNKATDYDRKLGKPIAWAVVMTRNKAIDRLRARQRGNKLVERAASEIADEGTAPPPEADQDRAEHLRVALDDLPIDQRRVIELAFFRGLSQSEIASQLSQPLGTIKARIRRGMLKLRDKLQNIRREI